MMRVDERQGGDSQREETLTTIQIVQLANNDEQFVQRTIHSVQHEEKE
jgi:hypothetical protein